MKQRSNFSSKIGFVLAAAGSAVGLGNIWRFPYLAARYGGRTFLLVYLLLAVTFGFTLMIAETAIGRKTGLSAIGAFKKLDKRFTFLGWLAALVPIIILPYYSVIGGWVIKYFAVSLSNRHFRTESILLRYETKYPPAISTVSKSVATINHTSGACSSNKTTLSPAPIKVRVISVLTMYSFQTNDVK